MWIKIVFGIFLLIITVTLCVLFVVPKFMQHPDLHPQKNKTRTGIDSISAALEMYKLDNFVYPTTAQGLDALINEAVEPPIPVNFSTNGYLKSLPKDEWKRDFKYRQTQEGFDLISFGRDGREGGAEEGTDIRRQ